MEAKPPPKKKNTRITVIFLLFFRSFLLILCLFFRCCCNSCVCLCFSFQFTMIFYLHTRKGWNYHEISRIWARQKKKKRLKLDLTEKKPRLLWTFFFLILLVVSVNLYFFFGLPKNWCRNLSTDFPTFFVDFLLLSKTKTKKLHIIWIWRNNTLLSPQVFSFGSSLSPLIFLNFSPNIWIPENVQNFNWKSICAPFFF